MSAEMVPGAGRALPRPSAWAAATRPRATLPYELAAVAAWVALGAHLLLSDPAEHAASGPHAMTAPHHLGMWALMCVAMMLPAALPAIAHVAANSLRRRRARATATFAAVYLGIWLAFGGLVLALAPLWQPLPAGVPLAGALALAAGWQLTVGKRRALAACHRTTPLPPTGWRATTGAARFGLRNASACVGSCWALMVAMGIASGPAMLPLMAALTGVVTVEKLTPRPRRATRAAAAGLAVAVVAVAIVAVAATVAG